MNQGMRKLEKPSDKNFHGDHEKIFWISRDVTSKQQEISYQLDSS